jgi:ABC-type phosphate/phosphonate transport system substrate-binding protein
VVRDGAGQLTSSGWQDLFPERTGELRLLESSLAIPGDCIGHRPNFSEQWFEDLRAAFLNLHQSAEGRELLEHAFRAQRFVAGEVEPYEAIKDVLQRPAGAA